MGLSQGVLWNEEQGILRTALYTLWITLTEIALERNIHITVEKNSAKRARHYALLAGNTFFFVNFAISLFGNNRISGAVFPALRVFTLFADYRHSDHRVGIEHHHPYATLLRIIGAKAVDGTDHFTKFTSRAPLWNYR